ncbi:MAG TPA: ThiF family adenylyltransferase [Chloroflexota bacterium]|nr:ThiF family adenylyltransferase [Chloroflexota bacterium]
MTYVIDPSPPIGARGGVRWEYEATIVVVGCGGTGGFLAESIGRLLIGRSAQLCLVDPDRVEPHNLVRQAFAKDDLNRFKAQVLAERLSRRFGREIGYAVQPYDREVHAQAFGNSRSRLDLLCGCVDNAAARRALTATLDEPIGGYGYPLPRPGIWYLDVGNGRNSGQILLGNVTRPEGLRGAFDRESGLCRALPAPGFQRPDLLDAPPPPLPALDCAEAVAQAEQGGTINQVVAAIAVSYLEKLLAGTCAWMATYVDLDDGTLRCVHADPHVVATLAGLHVNAVAPPARAAS